MAKSNVTLSIDNDILEAMRGSGYNMSETAEQSFMSIVGAKKRFLHSIFEDEDRNEVLNRIVNTVSRSPHTSKFWARYIRETYSYNVTKDELLMFVRELTDINMISDVVEYVD